MIQKLSENPPNKRSLKTHKPQLCYEPTKAMRYKKNTNSQLTEISYKKNALKKIKNINRYCKKNSSFMYFRFGLSMNMIFKIKFFKKIDFKFII